MKRTLLALVALLLVVGRLGTPQRWTVPAFPFVGGIVEATYTPTPIKSIQQGTIAIAVASLSNTATITAVTTANAAVYGHIFSSQSTSGIAGNGDLCYVVLTSSTVLTATRAQTAGAGTGDAGCNIAYTVVEYLPQFIKSNQRGTTTVAATNATTALSPAVTVAKAMCYLGGMSQTGTIDDAGESFPACWVSATNAVSLELAVVGGGTTNVMAWTVLEFK